MKPAPFHYESPAGVEEALLLLDEDSRPLAGGQSLVPLLNFRLARPARLVDLERVAELAYVRRDGPRLRIGAMARQAELEASDVVARGWPLLGAAVRHVGHPAIRNRGTIGGSVSHADPSAELPVALSALGARFTLRSSSGVRSVSADELFLGPLHTAIRPDELLAEIELPPPPDGARAAFSEYARTHGDFALAGAAVQWAPGGHAAIALLGAEPRPVRAPEAERALAQGAPGEEVGALAARDVPDRHRRALVGEMVRRAVLEARA